jgi:CDP-glucose 4,6-dehydratase
MSSKGTVLITGHTGLKGTWLTLMLIEAGYSVVGASTSSLPYSQDHYGIFDDYIYEHYRDKYASYDCNVLDSARLRSLVCESHCTHVIHLAAQPLVSFGQSYPDTTWVTNVIGTHNCILAAVASHKCKSLIVSTSDKVYSNNTVPEHPVSFTEDDKLGNLDPYGASKAAADLMAQSYSCAVSKTVSRDFHIFVVRAGNVVGGGDLSKFRLLPDLHRSTFCGQPLEIRNPSAMRPWQHVLDCSSAYLRLLEHTPVNTSPPFVFNIGPANGEMYSVTDVIDAWPGNPVHIRNLDQPSFSEQHLLSISSSKANAILGWHPRISFQRSIHLCFEVYKRLSYPYSGFREALRQIHAYSEYL